MKRPIAIVLSITIVAISCHSSHTLDKTTAMNLVKREMGYPKALDYEIYCGDPGHARKMINSGLEKQGLVIVKRTQKLSNISDPIIQFTDEARKYFLPTPDEEKKHEIQRVKIADENLGGITNIQYNEGHSRATVEYTVIYQAITPFSVLMKKDLHKPDRRTAVFIYSGGDWVFTDQRH